MGEYPQKKPERSVVFPEPCSKPHVPYCQAPQMNMGAPGCLEDFQTPALVCRLSKAIVMGCAWVHGATVISSSTIAPPNMDIAVNMLILAPNAPAIPSNQTLMGS